MPREDGIEVLLQVGDGATVESFNTLGGQISTVLSRAAAAVEASDKDSDDARNIPGKRSDQVTCSGNAVWPDTTGLGALETARDNKQLINCRLITDAAGTQYDGAFVVTQLDIQGDDGSATQYNLTLVCDNGLTKS